jgi:hypothetical protein
MANRTVIQQRRISRALGKLDRRALRALGREVSRTAAERELTYTGEDGSTEIMPMLLAPALLSHADVAYLHGLCRTLLDAVKKTATARATDPEVRAILPLGPGEEEWLALTPADVGPVVGRFDMNVDPAKGGARTANLLELNGCAIGGIHYGPAASETVLDRVVPLDREVRARMPAAMRDVWLDLCDEHARSIGRAAASHVVWLEDRDWDAGITEGPTLAAWLERTGRHGAVADPRELELRGDEIVLRGRPVDIIYRGIELRDLLLIEAETGPLHVLREAVRRNRVLSPLHGDLDHKSLLEVWTSPRFARLFTPAERRAFKKHVLWTRYLTERATEGPDGKSIDLPAYARKHRTKLVIKPNRACGGEGILVGRDTPQARWDKTIALALSGREPAIVQTYVRGAMIESPVVRGTRIHHEKHFTNYGLLASPTRLGILGRAAPFPVVNVSRGGGVMGVLLA